MEMFVVFNIPSFCSLNNFASHLLRVFVHLNTIRKQGLSRDLLCALRLPFFALSSSSLLKPKKSYFTQILDSVVCLKNKERVIRNPIIVILDLHISFLFFCL